MKKRARRETNMSPRPIGTRAFVVRHQGNGSTGAVASKSAVNNSWPWRVYLTLPTTCPLEREASKVYSEGSVTGTGSSGVNSNSASSMITSLLMASISSRAKRSEKPAAATEVWLVPVAVEKIDSADFFHGLYRLKPGKGGEAVVQQGYGVMPATVFSAV